MFQKKKNKMNKMNKMRMNKRAGFFALLLILFTIILTGYALYSFTLSKSNVDVSLDIPGEIVSFSQDIDKEIFYEQQRLELVSIQAFHETLLQGAMKSREDCKFTENYIIFNDACEPTENELAEVFIEKLEEKEDVEDYSFSFSEKNTKLEAQANEIKKEEQFSGPFATYNIEYNLEREFSVDFSEQGISFSKIINLYDKAVQCKDSESIELCVDVDVKDWELEFREEGYKYFNFKSKRYYIYDSKFAPLEFIFVLE